MFNMNLWDFLYKYFGEAGKSLLKTYRNIEEGIRKSGLHIYPPVYASLILFITLIVSMTFTIAIVVLLLKGYIWLLPFIIPIPFLIFVLMVHLPSLIASNRAGAIEGEFPYTTAYLSTMVMSGLSPYVAFERLLRASKILTKSVEIVQRFILLTKVLGKDPLTGFTMLADRTPSTSVRDLLTGFVTTVRAGGDVVDYLNKKARLMFSEILVKMKIAADRLGGLLESYLAVSLLSLISLLVMYYVSVSFAGVVAFGLGLGSLFLVIYILLPFISGLVIYLADLIQYKESWIDYRPYLFFGSFTIPAIIVTSIFGIVLYYVLPDGNPLKESFIVKGLYIALTTPARLVNAPEYLYPSTALAVSMIIFTLPAALYTYYVMREHKLIFGLTRFLRDLVEVRKTGLSPERAIVELSSRDYGIFSKYLRRIAMQLNLGIPLRRIIEDLLDKIMVWRAKVLLFTMTDTIEVGGGTIETLENLAWFAESVEAIDNEMKRSMRTLLIVPYMGAILSAVTVIMLTVYMGSVAGLVPGFAAAYTNAALVTLPAVIINNYFMGLVAGKVSGGSVAEGFKHCVILNLITLAAIATTAFIKPPTVTPI